MIVVIGFSDTARRRNPRVVFVGEKASAATPAVEQSKKDGCQSWGILRNPLLQPFKLAHAVTPKAPKAPKADKPKAPKAPKASKPQTNEKENHENP